MASKPKRSSSMVERLPLTEARVHLGEVIKRVHIDKARIILEKDGIPVAGLLDIDEFEDYLELQDPKVREHIRKNNKEYLAGKSRPAEEFLAELRQEGQRRTKRRQKA